MITKKRLKYIREKNRAARKRNATFVFEHKKGKKCRDCGGAYPPHVLDYDHINPKTKIAKVSRLATQAISLKRIKEEIDKTQIVCANCHRERTYKRRKNNIPA